MLILYKNNINQKWKKEIQFPKNWTNFTLDNNYFNNKYNGLALLTGKINNIIVIDIDNVEHWKALLKENDKKEPQTVKVRSGSGGIHLYFKYNDDLNEIKSTSKCFGKKYDIDIRTNGGCIIVPPTKYFNKNVNKDVEYIWEKNMFENQMLDMSHYGLKKYY